MSDKQKFDKQTPSQLWKSLEATMKMTGMQEHIASLPDKRKQLREMIVALTKEGLSQPAIYYYAYVPIIRDILKDDFYWFIRWATDVNRVEEIHKNIIRFFETGELPDNYKYAEHAIFKYSKNANVQIVMMPRGLGKTTIFVGAKAVWKFLKRPTIKILLIHSSDDKVQQNLQVIKSILMSPPLALVFPELFATNVELYRNRGARLTRTKIDIPKITFSKITNDEDFVFRKEATFNTATPNIDTTGLHFNEVFADDVNNFSNSASEKQQQVLYNYITSLSGLEEYTDDNYGFPITITETMWFVPSYTTRLIEERNDVSVFIMPLTWDKDPQKDRQQHEHRISKFVTDDFIRRKEQELGQWFLSQMYMVGRPREAELSLVGDSNFIFAFSDETEVGDVIILPFTRKEAIVNGFVCVSKDPSYSMNNKTMDDEKSKDTTITTVFYEEKLLVIDEYQQLGGEEDALYNPLLQQCIKNKADACIVDSQGTQQFVSSTFFKKLRKDYKRTIMTIPYTKPKQTTGRTKAERAMSTLATLFTDKLILVHHSCVRTKKQVMRENQGYDILDCLIMTCSLDFAIMETRAKIKQETYKQPTVRRKRRRPLFGTTKY